MSIRFWAPCGRGGGGNGGRLRGLGKKTNLAGGGVCSDEGFRDVPEKDFRERRRR